MKRLDRILTIVMAAFTGAFLGHGIYLFWEQSAHPELYASWSAPWYVQLIVPGIVLVCVLVLGAGTKCIIHCKLKKS